MEEGALDAFVNRLTEPGEAGAASRFFRKKNNRKVKLGGREWLFSGQVRFRSTTLGTRQSWGVDLLLEVNLTRFISARGLPSAIIQYAHVDEGLLRADPAHAATLHALDHKDNVIASNSRLGEAQQANWPAEFVALLRIILEFVQRRIRMDIDVIGLGSAAIPQPHFVFDWSEWVLKQVEAYWEFYSVDATAEVEKLRGMLPRLAAEVRATHYGTGEAPSAPGEVLPELDEALSEPELATERQVQSSQSLSIPLGAEKLNLGIYAKTPTRLRFEVRHYGNVRNSLSGHATVGDVPNDRYEQIEGLLDIVAERSAVRMHLFLRTLARLHTARQPNASTMAFFLVDLANACGNDRVLMRQLLSELMSTGRLVAGGSSPRAEALDYLLKRRILQKRSVTLNGSKSVYDLWGSYHSLGMVLRAALQTTTS
jgi:hypothetical protein